MPFLPSDGVAQARCGSVLQPACLQEFDVEISRLFVIALIVIVGFWLVNRMYYSNQKYDLEYRRKRFAKPPTPPAGE